MDWIVLGKALLFAALPGAAFFAMAMLIGEIDKIGRVPEKKDVSKD